MAIKKIIEFVVKSKTAKKDVDNLNKSIDDNVKVSTKATQSTKELDKSYSKSSKSTSSFARQARDLRVQMEQLDTSTVEGAEAFNKLAGEAGDLIDKSNLAKTAVNESNLAMSTAVEVAGLAASAYATYQGIIAMTGIENEKLEKTMVKLQAAMAVAIGVNQLANSVNSSSTLILRTQALQIRAKAAAEAMGTKGTIAATVAQRALNAAANANPYVLLAVALVTVVGAIALFSKETKEAAIEYSEFSKSVSEGTAGLITDYTLLQRKWVELEGDLEKQNKFLEENKGGFDKLGVSVNDVNDAESIFVTNTGAFIAALMARAKAEAARQLAVEAFKKSIQDSIALDENLEEQSSLFGPGVRTDPKVQQGLQEQGQILRDSADESEKEANRYLDIFTEFSEEYEEIISSIGISEVKTTIATTTKKDKKSIDELTALFMSSRSKRIKAIDDVYDRNKKAIEDNIKDDTLRNILLRKNADAREDAFKELELEEEKSIRKINLLYLNGLELERESEKDLHIERKQRILDTVTDEDEKNRLLEAEQKRHDEAMAGIKLGAEERIKEIMREVHGEEIDETIEEKLQRQMEEDLAELKLLEASEEQKTDLINAYEERLADEREKRAQEEKKRQELVAKNQITLGLQALGALSGAMNEQSELSKGIAIAETTWNTANAIMAAMKDSEMPWFAKIANSITAGAMGLTQIKRIASTNPGKGGASGGGGTRGMSSPVQPSFNIVGDARQQAMDEVNAEQEDRPIKTYVVAGEVSTAQELDRNRVRNSRFL